MLQKALYGQAVVLASYKDKARMTVSDSVSGRRLWFVVSLTADLTQASPHAVTVQEMMSPPTIG